MENEDLYKRIEIRLKKLKLTANQASEDAGLDRSFIRQIKQGKKANIRIDNARKLASALKCSTSWLLEGVGPEELSGQISAAKQMAEGLSPAASHLGPKDLPIYGDATVISSSFPLNHGSVVAYTFRSALLADSPQAFAVFTTGSDMEPRYFRGELLLIDPSKMARPNDFVLIEDQDGNASIRKLLKLDEEGVQVEKLNPRSESTIGRDQVKHLYLISGSYDLSRQMMS
ncbi:helix-turn-helix domain-containing protein [Thalassospira aquimaris]|uniref:S24 family peptidase n=1 Tax=Thalassospira aquimaris TaxID=3037796 RepID=A0ABT6GGJ3_9PROT|nr:S24 family peptidase [Thalassospira sp. FZY0004]MDG4721183.1 S24 family peptidase [Thalassospira sp. FZY0004]